MSVIDRLPPQQRDVLAPFVRTGYRPRVEPGVGTGPCSKIGGPPWLQTGTAWPDCPNCRRPMQLLLQLDLSSLPDGAPGRGHCLAQLFYCLSSEPLCEVDCEAFFPFSKSQVARLLDPSKGGADAPARAVPNPVKPKRIVGWTGVEDLPQPQELVELGIAAEYQSPLYETLMDLKLPLSRDKLGGWPYWVQSVEYPPCPECKEPMRLLYQIDSEDLVEQMWGDSGCAHLTQCAAHPHQLAFGWACC